MIGHRLIQDAGLIPAISTILLSTSVWAGDCKILTIRYDNENNYIHTTGDCENLYRQCTEDFCDVKKIKQINLNFYGDEPTSIGLKSEHDNTLSSVTTK